MNTKTSDDAEDLICPCGAVTSVLRGAGGGVRCGRCGMPIRRAPARNPGASSPILPWLPIAVALVFLVKGGAFLGSACAVLGSDSPVLAQPAFAVLALTFLAIALVSAPGRVGALPIGIGTIVFYAAGAWLMFSGVAESYVAGGPPRPAFAVPVTIAAAILAVVLGWVRYESIVSMDRRQRPGLHSRK